jgi:cobalt/nickel transport system permease protein
MGRIQSALWDIGTLDELADQDTPLHRLDPRAKLITTLLFIAAVTSFDRYEVAALMPFTLYPAVLISVGRLPVGRLLKKGLLAAPFAVFIGIFNPLLDREIVLRIGSIGISGGWISFASILIRFTLTVSAALILVAGTGFEALCMALVRLKVPRVFVVQLLLLYRYLFLLMEEGARMVRAHALRAFGERAIRIRVFGSLVGQLLLRTLGRGQRIHVAMLCRGFDGEVRLVRSMRMGVGDVCFVMGWSTFFVMARLYNLPHLLGSLVLGGGR